MAESEAIRHNFASSAATVGYETAKTTVKTFGFGILAAALLGGLVVGGIVTAMAGFGALALGLGLLGAIGAGFGGGLFATAYAAPIAAISGGVGVLSGARKVSMENDKAAEVARGQSNGQRAMADQARIDAYATGVEHGKQRGAEMVMQQMQELEKQSRQKQEAALAAAHEKHTARDTNKGQKVLEKREKDAEAGLSLQ